MNGPSQGNDLLEGVYRTPLDLLRAVDQRWSLEFDLAADRDNNAIWRLGKGGAFGAPNPFFSELEDAVAREWPRSEAWSWLNPPYGDIGSWTAKAAAEAKLGARVVMLLPSATGASWLKPCRESAQIVFLIGRPVFQFLNPMTHKNPAKAGKPNTDPYGKDVLLAVFGQGQGVSWWDWRGK
jgi:hypothetical protein